MINTKKPTNEKKINWNKPYINSTTWQKHDQLYVHVKLT